MLDIEQLGDLKIYIEKSYNHGKYKKLQALVYIDSHTQGDVTMVHEFGIALAPMSIPPPLDSTRS